MEFGLHLTIFSIIVYFSFAYSEKYDDKPSVEGASNLPQDSIITREVFEYVTMPVSRVPAISPLNMSLDHFSFVSSTHFSSQFNESLMDSKCWKKAECQPLEHRECLGVELPYTHTSLAMTGFYSQLSAKKELEMWTSLKSIPRCWSVIQPFLCAVFFPKCENGSVQLPSQEMCAITRSPCRLIDEVKGWPNYLTCIELYSPKCKNIMRELEFKWKGECALPLIPTIREDSWFQGIKGCAVQCQDPLYSPEEHDDIHAFIGTIGGICLACTLLTVFTYLIDWRSASKYPALIIFYVNVCFLISGIGFLVQFQASVREDVTCQKDGTLRQAEPSSGGNLSCVIVFVCIYYFMIAAGLWLIILAYSWHRSFKTLAAGQSREELENCSAYFHLLAWSIPLVLTITIMAMAEVHADSLAGVCFLSPFLYIRICFLLLPIIAVVIIGGLYLVKGIKTLVHLKIECSNIISDHANSKIVETIIRLGIFVAALILFTVISLYVHVYQYQYSDVWAKSLRQYILCKANLTKSSYDYISDSGCFLNEKPSINVYKLNLLAFFGSGIVMSSWCWTRNTFSAWKRFLRRVAGTSREENMPLTKHKVIAQAFAKRHHLNTIGRLSISLHSEHDDPVGLNFQMNSSVTGDEVSSAWAAAIPQLIMRRGAVASTGMAAMHRNSVDSDYSVSRRFSFESTCYNHSRGHSFDSQLSLSDGGHLTRIHSTENKVAKKQHWFSLRRSQRHRASLDTRSSSDVSNKSSMMMPRSLHGSRDTLFTTMMRKLQLSSSDATSVGLSNQIAPKEEAGIGNGGYTQDDSSITYAGLKATGIEQCNDGYIFSTSAYEEIRLSRRKQSRFPEGTLTSVAVQTSLPGVVHTENKSTQVSTPMLVKAFQTPSAFSSCDGIAETAFTKVPITDEMVDTSSESGPKRSSRDRIGKEKRCHTSSHLLHKPSEGKMELLEEQLQVGDL